MKQLALFEQKETNKTVNCKQKIKSQIKDRINQLRRNIAVHSFIYYRLNTSIISDKKFDNLCNELIDLQNKHPNIANECVFNESFKNFKYADCFNLNCLRNSWTMNKAQYLVKEFG